MHGDMRPIPDETIRTEECAFFRYTEGPEIKVTAYRRLVKVMQINFNFELGYARVICNHPYKEELVQVEKLVRQYLPENVFLTDILWDAIRGKSGITEVRWEI
jgi:hypothetical protein